MELMFVFVAVLKLHQQQSPEINKQPKIPSLRDLIGQAQILHSLFHSFLLNSPQEDKPSQAM